MADPTLNNPVFSEGHFTISEVSQDVDCDHGPCTGYYVQELGFFVYLYENDPTRISFHDPR